MGASPRWELRPAPDLLDFQPAGDDPTCHVAAACTQDGKIAILYLPVGGDVTVKLTASAAEWFDPRTGQRKPAQPTSVATFHAPDAQDWMLVL